MLSMPEIKGTKQCQKQHLSVFKKMPATKMTPAYVLWFSFWLSFMVYSFVSL
jgi:hypothetical protein